MDPQTVLAYDQHSARFASDWIGQAPPDDMYALLRKFFRPGKTADVGCGAGRDVAWMAANGFDAVGYDASLGLLEQARLAYPGLAFVHTALPALEGVPTHSYDNVLCETVLMHLAPQEVGVAVRSLLALLRPQGTLYLSWRVTPSASKRDGQGRLYAAFDSATVLAALQGNQLLLDQEDLSVSSGKVVHRIVVRKPAA